MMKNLQMSLFRKPVGRGQKKKRTSAKINILCLILKRRGVSSLIEIVSELCHADSLGVSYPCQKQIQPSSNQRIPCVFGKGEETIKAGFPGRK